MAITFDGATKRIILDSASVSAAEIWSRWVDWAVSNGEWLFAFRQVGGDDLGGGLSIPPYYFLMNGWRVRPMESSHNLVITGNLFVDGGGVPVVNTIGTYQVNVNYTVPVQAQGIATGGGSGASAADVWAYANRTLTSGTTDGLFSMPLAYKASNNTAAADPGAGKIRWNHATQASATALYFDSLTDDGVDLTPYLLRIAAGSRLYIQDKNDSAKYQQWVVASVTDNTGWFTAVVALTDAGGGNIANNQQVVAVVNAVGTADGLTSDQAAMLARVEKFLRNKRITNPTTGVQTVYDDDGSTVLGQGNLFEDAAGTQPYRGQGAERSERLA